MPLSFEPRQTLVFPTEGPSSFELPEAGVLELTFAANRPVAPPAWTEKHARAALQKVRQRMSTAARILRRLCVACWGREPETAARVE